MFRENVDVKNMEGLCHIINMEILSREKYAWWMGDLYFLLYIYVLWRFIMNVCFFSVTQKQFFWVFLNFNLNFFFFNFKREYVYLERKGLVCFRKSVAGRYI